MSSSDWRSLKDHRDNIRLAEIAALLHDAGKCTSEFAYSHQGQQVSGAQPHKAIFAAGELGQFNFSADYVGQRTAEANQTSAFHRLLDARWRHELDVQFEIDGSRYSVREAVYFGRPSWARHDRIRGPIKKPPEPLNLVGYCHDFAHVEKEDPPPGAASGDVAVCSPFGRRLRILPRPGPAGDLKERLNTVDFGEVVRKLDKVPLMELFHEALGDTRYPVNEVTLWDWSYAVASLYKSELARHFLTGGWRTKREELRWRVLRINFDVLGLYAKAIKIADLLGYQEAVRRTCEEVKKLVEDEFPLGNELYRDTTGIYFTFPDVNDQKLSEELTAEIRKRVEGIEPELAPRIAIGDAHGEEKLKVLLSEQRNQAIEQLATPFVTETLSGYWAQQWANLSGDKWEVCPVCHLRPTKEGEEACEHCKKRRKSRVGTWRHSPDETIWVDELADENGRLALIVGKFGLEDWLSGDLVQTLLVRAVKGQPESCVPKNPSPARLRRIWETTKAFWEQSVEELRQAIGVRNRWALIPKVFPSVEMPPEVEVCDGTLQGKPVSVWRVDDRFLTISFLPEKPTPGRLEISWGRGNNKESVDFEIGDVQEPADELAKYRCYAPCLTLLSSPDQFLTLVPASDAVDLTQRIYKRYQTEFGKVQNRLPLFLGLVFFQRKTSLSAVMDTARRMLEQVKSGEEEWAVKSNDGNGRIAFENGFCWQVPVTMGDGKEDVWYPYFLTRERPKDAELSVPMKEPNFEVGAKYADWWLIHARELQPGDRVTVMPSRFGYFFLDHTAKRFAFDPDKDVRYLDELPKLIGMWKALCKTEGMTDTKLRGIADLFRMKGELWDEGPELRQLVETTLKKEAIDCISTDDVLSGRFASCLELYMHILKERVKTEKQHEQQTATV